MAFLFLFPRSKSEAFGSCWSQQSAHDSLLWCVPTEELTEVEAALAALGAQATWLALPQQHIWTLRLGQAVAVGLNIAKAPKSFKGFLGISWHSAHLIVQRGLSKFQLWQVLRSRNVCGRMACGLGSHRSLCRPTPWEWRHSQSHSWIRDFAKLFLSKNCVFS